MNCPNCKKEITESSIFCPYCSFKIKLHNSTSLISLPIAVVGGIFTAISLNNIGESSNFPGEMAIGNCIISFIVAFVGLLCGKSYVNQYRRAAIAAIILSILFTGIIYYVSF